MVKIPASRYLIIYLAYANCNPLDLAGKYLNLQHCRQQRSTYTHTHMHILVYPHSLAAVMSYSLATLLLLSPHTHKHTQADKEQRGIHIHTCTYIHTRTLAATLFTPMPKHSKHNNAVCFALLACSGK